MNLILHPNSIKAMCGLVSQKNSVHGSDSLHSTQRKISFFFEEETGKIYSLDHIRTIYFHICIMHAAICLCMIYFHFLLL